MTKALYRKLNDGSHNSSTFHKKDGTPVRAILREELRKEMLVRGPADVSPADQLALSRYRLTQ